MLPLQRSCTASATTAFPDISWITSEQTAPTSQEPSCRLSTRFIEFDRRFRNLLLGMIEPIEISIRTKIAQYLAVACDPLGACPFIAVFPVYSTTSAVMICSQYVHVVLIREDTRINGQAPIYPALKI